jgi:lipocalin
MRYVLIAVAALSCLAGTSAAQPSPANDVLLQRLAGTWILRGDIRGRATTHDITAEWILDRLYLQIHEISREKAANGLFRSADGAVSFNNTFSYDRATDSWTWHMDNVQNGKAIPFGRVRLTRH